ncbi:MAG: DEAD/DEAH box helicase [Gemmatimonadales bacterium]
MISFESLKLAPELLRAVADEGYTEPTPIQAETIPLVLTGRDVVGSAQTGTGKTAAFMLPILQRLMRSSPNGNGKKPGIRALVLVPTRELAEQVLTSARAYGRHTKVRAAAVYGGVGYGPQKKACDDGVEIIVATPGRLLDHMGRNYVRTGQLEVMVLDEADRMLDMGFARDVNRILDTLPHDRQTLFFSATISYDVDQLARKALDGLVPVEIGRRAETAEGVEHMVVAVDQQRKREVLAHLLRERPEDTALVFTRTKHGADRLARQLRKEVDRVSALHGGKTQQSRNKALDSFRDGKARVLVATDVAARGIDVDSIGIVVNYDVPADPEVYVHRVGRTARAGATGRAVTLLSPHEWIMMREVEKLIGKDFERHAVPGFEPSIMPMQPHERPVNQQARPQDRTLGPRRGRSRRR